ncbi:hypothetical protein BDR26DRAFT_802301 [Obelidium mucronatum]|nr:hypothetical protein BDR26DRAFT_802301 [Obelidium mucronatum]
MNTAQAELDRAKAAITADWKAAHPDSTEGQLIDYLAAKPALQQLREDFVQSKKLYNDVVNKFKLADALSLTFPHPADKQKKAMKSLMTTKPSVSFSHVTFDDCKRVDGLSLDLGFIERGKSSRATIHLPEEVKQMQIEPSASLCEYLSKLDSLWAFNSEMSCRTRIDAILVEALHLCDAPLLIFCELENDWSGDGIDYTGNVDYMIGSAPSADATSKVDSFILVVEAKREWPDSAVAQVLAEAGCLLKKRLASNKNTPVFAVLTNGRLFQFFALDMNGVVFCSGPLIALGQGDNGWVDSPSLIEILRWLMWFINCMKLVSPRVPAVQLTHQDVNENVQKIIECFGSNKKARHD